jgi:hypothetical protein
MKKPGGIVIIVFTCILLATFSFAGNDPELPDESIEICPMIMAPSTQTTTFSLSIYSFQLVFDFYFLSDFENGLGANHDHFISASVNSSERWALGCYASSDLIHTNGVNTIPINQVGIEIDLVGNYGNNKIKNNAKNHPVAIQLTEYVLLEPRNKNKSNAGDDSDNAFVFYFEMGTGNGNMNNTDFSSAGYQFGQYQTTLTFILREDL